MSKHHLSAADEIYQGAGYYAPINDANGRKGAPVTLLTKIELGAPEAALATGLVNAATSTELPSASTITYTTADDGSTPLDSASRPDVVTIQTASGATASVYVLDVPRNVSLNATHDSSLVAMTCTVTGYDEWRQKVVETLSITATGTEKTAAGKKAIKYVESIALTSAGNATTNTANLGWADVLGLPYRLDDKSDLIAVFGDGVQELATSTVAAAVSTTPSATTGDVRGTVAPATSPDGTKTFSVWMHVADKGSAAGLKGVDQYEG